MSGSFWAGSIPPWAWVLYVCAAGIFIILVLLAELHGRKVGYGQAEEDWKADRAAGIVRSWRGAPGWGYRANLPHTRVVMPQAGMPVKGERTAAFLNPPAVPPEVAHEAWLAHTDLAIAIANDPANDDDFSVTAWTQEKGEMLDAWLAE
ncbi:MAG TPA: hypothetical protein VKS82_07270, partial [Streptosporangiaceae bacterium]|nr:hypothetical protein [Streptosporangiaceae bacterium]